MIDSDGGDRAAVLETVALQQMAIVGDGGDAVDAAGVVEPAFVPLVLGGEGGGGLGALLRDVDAIAEEIPAQVARVGRRLPGEAQPRRSDVVEAGTTRLQWH